ncbi:hypothetical protein BKA64DRAFT_648569 [Cadophora sp. MPI-SDFR-AT-0126]|nr:hypothetical protein BKA64DRAFT_648569 [Leotiomycetes sp. MPI-SDFR-AT-0126]
MDGLSTAASVIAVIQIAGQVFLSRNLCRTYYLDVKEARKDIQRLRDEVTSLQDVLTDVADLADAVNSAGPSILGLLNQPNGPVQLCQKDLAGLAAKLEPGHGKYKMKQFGYRALKWPFNSKEVEKLLTTIGRHKATFNLALTTDNVSGREPFLQMSAGKRSINGYHRQTHPQTTTPPLKSDNLRQSELVALAERNSWMWENRFMHMVGYFRQAFIIIDALDECTEQEALLGLIEKVVGWKFENLHILVTSQPEGGIEDALKPLVTDQICIQSTLVNADMQ